ncbi:MAG: HD-GYP domain-containing protein [Armatimonadetes bacterium]|nr:HD-GYP domain-containing protein [Armatimonadota bacterium]
MRPDIQRDNPGGKSVKRSQRRELSLAARIALVLVVVTFLSSIVLWTRHENELADFQYMKGVSDREKSFHIMSTTVMERRTTENFVKDNANSSLLAARILKKDVAWFHRSLYPMLSPMEVSGAWILGQDFKIEMDTVERQNPALTRAIQNFDPKIKGDKDLRPFYGRVGTSIYEFHIARIKRAGTKYFLAARELGQDYSRNLGLATGTGVKFIDAYTKSNSVPDGWFEHVEPLRDINGRTVGVRKFTARSLVAQGLAGAAFQNVIASLALLFVGLGVSGFLLYTLVHRPLKILLKAIGKDDKSTITKYEADSTELGQLAKLALTRLDFEANLNLVNRTLMGLNTNLEAEVQIRTKQVAESYDATIHALMNALEYRDQETKGHCERVTVMTEKIAVAMGICEPELTHIRRGALLHDIGKIAIPDAILLKPGALSPEERAVMQTHAEIGYEMLKDIQTLRPSLDLPRCHHEKWDGTGYPRQLKGEEIPLAARIFAISDVWDALSSDRPYRRAWDPDRVRDHIASLSGSHFDPSVVQAFLRLQEFEVYRNLAA